MNKSFKTNAMNSIKGKSKSIDQIKWLAGQSCYIKTGEPMDLNDHPLKDETFRMIDNNEIVFS